MTINKQIKELRRRIDYDFGPKCGDFSYTCMVCQTYRALETLEETYADLHASHQVIPEKK